MKTHIISFLFIFLYLLSSIFGQKDDKKTIVTELSTPEDLTLLAPIKPNEVLPLVLVQSYFSTAVLQPPKSMDVVTIKKGRMMPSTEFYSGRHGVQIFFCPSENKIMKCVTPKEFKSSRPLQCDESPVPIYVSEGIFCGGTLSGTLFKYIYEICSPPKGYLYNTRELKIYEFCYHQEEHKLLYTKHEILSPLLLQQNFLVYERDMKFDTLMDIDGLDDNLSYSIYLQKLYRGRTKMINSKLADFPYEIQELVPPEHMAFAQWKKPTLNFINKEFQHKDLIPLWDEINRFVAIDATIMQFNAPYVIYTGVFDISEKISSWDQFRFSTFWVQMITATFTPERRTGIAIIMDNFIYSPRNNTEDTSDAEGNQWKGRFCEDDLCDESIRTKFARVRGRINCCPINGEIQRLFGTRLRIDGLLRIYGLIKT